MPLPDRLENLLEETLSLIRNEPDHEFKPFHRLQFYAAFEIEIEPRNKTTLLWLQIITARYVLPIWEKHCTEYYDDLPEELLTLAEDVVNGLVSPKSKIVKVVSEKAYNLFRHLENYSDNVLYAGKAAKEALSQIILWSPFQTNDIDENLTDEEFRDNAGGDAASAAVKAVATICDGINWTETSDPQKRLEFWEWWLTEAIPQAWELALGSAAQAD